MTEPNIVALDELSMDLRGGAIAIGNFDGMHRGHQALLKAARREADDRGCKALLLTFDPHPRSIFRPDTALFQLTPLDAKARLVAALGLDALVVLTFDREFSQTDAAGFVDNIIVAKLGASSVIVGHDFHFGRGRLGTPAFLAQAGAAHGFSTSVLDVVTDGQGDAYSSSRIRRSLESGAVAMANAELGYRWFVTGAVQHGDKRGRELGYPTANIRLSADCGLALGIYAVTLMRADGSLHHAVASYGRRPTFDNGAVLLEVFVFDFHGDLYGEKVIVTFHEFLRGEAKFDSIEALIAQMDQDSLASRRILGAAGPGTDLDEGLARIRPSPPVAEDRTIR